jgi:hypothetical protein
MAGSLGDFTESIDRDTRVLEHDSESPNDSESRDAETGRDTEGILEILGHALRGNRAREQLLVGHLSL